MRDKRKAVESTSDVKPDRVFCLREQDHVAHYWRYSDESEVTLHECMGFIRIYPDIIERPVNAD